MNKLDIITEKDIINYLNERDPSIIEDLFRHANELKIKYRGPEVYFRGLIEISNICSKNCYYCGIRSGNDKINRYELQYEQALKEAEYALEMGYGSIVIQGGERSDKPFIEKITHLIKDISKLRNNKIGITLSLGEQSDAVFKEWFDAGATRYLLRIEEFDKSIYEKIHPQGNERERSLHSYGSRIKAIESLKRIGYLTGTGVMIGLPWQTVHNLADDLMFFKDAGVDMVGMGPYIPHPDTPLYKERECILWNDKISLINTSLKMIALLRIIMPHINIAATTALQTLVPNAREHAILAGANVVMPNITDRNVRGNYQLYPGKPGVGSSRESDDANATKESFVKRLEELNIPIGWNKLGDWR